MTKRNNKVIHENNKYNRGLKSYAREHRNESTKAEIRLWTELLRNKQMLGYSFLRQRPIGKYIVDFFSKDLNLAIETDGLTHHDEEVVKNDLQKENYLIENGYSLLRFQDDDVMNNLDNIRRAIESWINDWKEKNGL